MTREEAIEILKTLDHIDSGITFMAVLGALTAATFLFITLWRMTK